MNTVRIIAFIQPEKIQEIYDFNKQKRDRRSELDSGALKIKPEIENDSTNENILIHMKEDIDSGLNARQLEEKYELHLNSGLYYYNKIAFSC